MEPSTLWSSMKTYYFRYENVILRVPFCFVLQLGTYFDKIVQGSGEGSKPSHEIAGMYVETY